MASSASCLREVRRGVLRHPDEGDDQPDGDGDSSGPGSTTADPGGCGQVCDPEHGDPAATRAVEAEWQVAVVQAEQAASGRGPLPAGLGRVVEQVVHPPVDWRSVLREFVATQAKNDYSWSRPNRRFLAQGLYLPGLYSEELGEVVLAIDTGSIDRKMLGDFAVEVNAVLGAYDCSVTVLYHDTEVGRCRPGNRPTGPLVLEPVGWRRDESRLCVRLADPDRHRAGLCHLRLTDLETEFPAAIPSVPVLWRSPATQRTASFGQVVTLSN